MLSKTGILAMFRPPALLSSETTLLPTPARRAALPARPRDLLPQPQSREEITLTTGAAILEEDLEDRVLILSEVLGQ